MEERLNYLFLQYLNNTCSQKELEEFFEYLRKTKTDNDLRVLIRKVYDDIKKTHPSLTYVDGYGNLVFNESARPHANISPASSQNKKLLRMLPIAILTLAATGAFWVFTRSDKKEPVVATVQSQTKKFTERKMHEPETTEFLKTKLVNLQWLFLLGFLFFEKVETNY